MSCAAHRIAIADRLAYVDDCLPRIDRAFIEETMQQDAGLRSEIETWLAQNEALRYAFPDHAAKRGAAGWSVADWLMVPDLTRQNARRAPEGGAAGAGESADDKSAGPPAAPTRRAAATWRGLARMVAGVAVALAVWVGAAILFSGNGAAPFAKAAAGAYRTYAEGRARPVEIATSDRDALSRWFAAQMAGATPIPDLTAAGLALVGGRVVPGAYAPAAFLLYEDPRRQRFAIQAENVEAPPETDLAIEDSSGLLSASWTGARHGFALVGRASRARLTELARLAREVARD